MKSSKSRFFCLSLIIAAILVLLWACSKDEGNNKGNGVQLELKSITVTSPSNEVALGAATSTMQFTAQGLDQNGDPISIPNLTWTSSNTNSATINSNGLATLLEVGEVTFTASSGSISGNKSISITFTAVLSSIEVTAEETEFVFGNSETIQVSATAFDQRGDELSDVEFEWSSSNILVANVDEQGATSIGRIGDAQIFASSEGVAGEITITVEINPAFSNFVIEDVSVVDVANGTTIDGQDVTIEGAFIQSIAPTGSVSLPPDANIVSGADKFLMSGLCDAHVHVFFETDFIQYLANSVTSIVDMGNSSAATPGDSPALDWKNGVVNGTLEGPNFYPSVMIRGPQDGGRTAADATEAIQLVQQWQDYDFIKAYSRVPESAFDALISEGANFNLSVIGHANVNIGMTEVLARGQKMIAHAEEYLYSHFLGNTSQALIDDAITKTLNAEAFVTGTLSTYEAISLVWGLNQSGYNQLKARPGYEFTNQAYKNVWDNQFNGTYNQPGSIEAGLTFQKDFLKQFHDTGIKILLGTDSPLLVGLPAGFSIHEDIRILSEMNISNADILKIGTMNFAEFIKRDSRIDNVEDFGQVLPGYRADLVLLNDNPLVNLQTLRTPNLVMVRGNAYLKSYLENALDKLKDGGTTGKYFGMIDSKLICNHATPHYHNIKGH